MAEDTDLLVQLFTRGVPEIAQGTVQIKAIARKAGIRSKLALQGVDPQIDCIAACVGPHGSRIKKIIDEIPDERIDLVRWYDSPEELITSALQPLQVEQVVLFPAEHRAVVKVPPDQVSLVLGPEGINESLASELSGWLIEVEPN
jgi:N utilization substance protein A